MNILDSFHDSGPCLYVCSTPIGNLDDATYRLVETLRGADVIAAEDTRHTRKLLNRFDIHPPVLISYHEHNRVARHPDFLRWWAEGKAVALVSDAGTPGVSDPGDDVVALALERDVPVIPVPGASAVLAALVKSGFPTQPFLFVGFLPRTRKEFFASLEMYDRVPATLVLYEAPHRIAKSLSWLAERWPQRRVAIVRELTKRHESALYGTTQDAAAHYAVHEPRGEFVVVLEPYDQRVEADEPGETEDRMALAVRDVKRAMEQGVPHAAAVKEAAGRHQIRRKDLYAQTLLE